MIKVSARVVFIKTKNLFNIYDINVTKILVSKKDSYGKIAHLNTLLMYKASSNDWICYML